MSARFHRVIPEARAPRARSISRTGYGFRVRRFARPDDGACDRCVRRCSIRCSRRCRRLPGIGPKLEKLFARLLGRDGEPPRIIDLLFHLPTGFVDRRNQPKLSRGQARHGRHRRRHHRPPPAAAAEPAARALQYRCERRHQHADHHLFQRAQGLSAKAPAGGRAALRLGHRDASMTATCRWCIPTAWSTQPVSPSCR